MTERENLLLLLANLRERKVLVGRRNGAVNGSAVLVQALDERIEQLEHELARL